MTSTPPRSENAVRIASLRVLPDRVVARVRIGTGKSKAQRYTTPELARRAAETHPNLPHHACVNSKGNTFSAVMERTPLPHLLEHLVIDIQTRDSKNSAAQFTGTSEWVCEEEGLAEVQVSYESDIAALAAFKEAANTLNRLLSNGM